MLRVKSLIKSAGIILLSLFLAHCGKSKGECEFRTDPALIKVEWTAFKTTSKTPVKGHFTTAKISGKDKGKTFAELAKSMSIDIDGATVETDNPGRNATLSEFFFQKFSPPSKITAKVLEVTGDDQRGDAKIEIQLNGVTKAMSFSYDVDPQGQFAATATLSMPDFKLQAAFDSLHQACGDLHKGTDGVSKTWDEVDLKVSGKVEKICQ